MSFPRLYTAAEEDTAADERIDEPDERLLRMWAPAIPAISTSEASMTKNDKLNSRETTAESATGKITPDAQRNRPSTETAISAAEAPEMV